MQIMIGVALLADLVQTGTDAFNIVRVDNIFKVDLIVQKFPGGIPHLTDIVGNVYQLWFIAGHPPEENHRAVVDDDLSQAQLFFGPASLKTLLFKRGRAFVKLAFENL